MREKGRDRIPVDCQDFYNLDETGEVGSFTFGEGGGGGKSRRSLQE
jgi:hypothetical protein